MNTGNQTEPPQSGGTTAAYLGLIVIWSTTPLAVVVSLRDFDAVWALALRMLLAAVFAQALLHLVGLRLSLSADAVRRYAIGSLSMFGAMLFTYLGARKLPSGMIAVLFGMAPLVVGLLSQVAFKSARFVALQWLGLLLALAGLGLIFLQEGELTAIDSLSVALVLTGVLCYGISALWLKQMPQALPPLVQTAGALWVSALASFLVVPFLAQTAPTHMPGAASALALVYSAGVGSIVAMLFYFYLLQRIEVGTMALTTLITPVFALLLGVLLNHESFHGETLWGMGLILVGLALYYARELRQLRAGREFVVQVPE